MTRFLDWLKSRLWPEDADSELPGRHFDQDARHLPFRTKPSGDRTATRSSNQRPAKPGRRPDIVELHPTGDGKLENRGPGKNVLIRNEFRRDRSGTQDTLKILDDPELETEDQQGFDPYNTGQFDRSRNWDKHTK